MNNMKSMLYDGYKAPGTPMTQMCPKDTALAAASCARAR